MAPRNDPELTAPFRRTTALLLLLLAVILAAPPASAAGRPAEAVSLSPLEALDRLWSFLRAAWTKDGCSINPNGQCPIANNTAARPSAAVASTSTSVVGVTP